MSSTASVSRRANVATILLAVLLAACGGAPVTASDPADGAGASAAEPADETGEERTLSLAYLSDIQTLDPAQAYDTVSWPAVRLMYETLLSYDAEAQLVPVLAEEMPEVSEDGLTYTFTIREGVSFVDKDGAVVGEMTAEDVVASLNRILDPELLPNPSPMSGSFWLMIEGAQAVVDGESDAASGIVMVDERTVEITITEPNLTFLNVLAMPFGSVLPADAPSDAEELTANPVGTGPFTLESYERGQQAMFVRNEHYWGEVAGNADRIEFRVGVDPNSALQQVQAGDLDVMADNPPAGSVNQVLDDPELADRTTRTPQVATTFLAMDTSGDAPTADVLVRQAISHAIDKENVVAVAHLGQVANCILPTEMPGHDPDCNPYPYDPERARELMEEAGLADGFSIELYTTTNDPDPATAQAIQQDLAEIGIEVEVVAQAFDTLLGTIVIPHQAPLVQIGWIQDFPDPADFYDPILSCGTAVEGNFNLAWYCNEEIDALAAEARGEQDRDARVAMYTDLFNQVMEDAPWVPLYFPEQLTVVSDRVSGFFHHPAWIFDYASYSIE